jgi:RNA polymerase sigma factor (sigma-70 family)
MAKDHQRGVVQDFHALFQLGTFAGLTDAKLLECYTSRGGAAAELAFAALVERHGPMVLRVCRAILRDEDAAHDAFQATFLVLVRRAGGLWVRDSLGPWLYQVACRVAHCARLAAARRRRHERMATEQGGVTRPPSGYGPGDGELAAVLHDELGRLPERYRAVIVLCHLEGLTQEQAARQLGWPLGTVQSRLARGRERLRGRLSRRGLAPAAGVLGAALAGERALAAVPAGLEIATAGVVPAAVSRLTEGVLRTMFWNQVRRITAVVLTLGLAAAGAAVLARQDAEDAPTATRPPAKAAKPSFVVEPPDMIRVEVLEALPGRPITGERLVRPDGKISLGYYGEVYVEGMTTAEIKESVISHLRKSLSDGQLGLVLPDPNRPGQSRAVAPAESASVFVDVTAYNSKNYYVIGAVAAPGRLHVTGNDTVLDAINYVGGLLPPASALKIQLVRPPVPGSDRPQVLDVDYAAITSRGDPRTNYTLRPDDRLIVTRDLKAEAELVESQPASGDPDVRRLEQRLENLERKLDRLIELLGGARPAAPAPRGDGAR